MRVHNVLSLSLAVLALVVSQGCGSKGADSAEQPGASQGSETPPIPQTGTVPLTKLTDGQITKILATVDTAEIEQAQVALQKATKPEVRAFANHMIEQHSAAKQKGEQLGLTAAESPKSQELQAKGTTTLEQLRAADPSTFELTYIDSQIEQHGEVLTMIENQLIPAVAAPALRDHLTEARGMVQSHLEQARKLRQ
jgi:putative membrane protein